MRKKTSYIRLEHAHAEHRNIYIVNWMAGNTCNYRCSYCPDYLHNGTSPWLSYQTAIDFCNTIILHNPSKKIVFEFTGGEITMWPDFIKVARYLHEHDVDVSILSNGSRTLRWWQEALPYLKRVHLSFHPGETNTEHFVDVLAFLKYKVSLHVNVMMQPESFDMCNNMAIDLEEKYSVAVCRQPLIVNLNGAMYAYTKEQLQILSRPSLQQIEQNTYRGEMAKIYPDNKKENHSCNYFISSYENNWNNWLCYAGVEQLIVTKEGDIYRGWCMAGGRIGNIAEQRISFPTLPVQCDKYECSCNFDIMCTKVRYAD
jgi:sulfatase maturation enzyme AslB (radical SAM superfamily)